jgi:hypothetical protein
MSYNLALELESFWQTTKSSKRYIINRPINREAYLFFKLRQMGEVVSFPLVETFYPKLKSAPTWYFQMSEMDKARANWAYLLSLIAISQSGLWELQLPTIRFVIRKPRDLTDAEIQHERDTVGPEAYFFLALESANGVMDAAFRQKWGFEDEFLWSTLPKLTFDYLFNDLRFQPDQFQVTFTPKGKAINPERLTRDDLQSLHPDLLTTTTLFLLVSRLEQWREVSLNDLANRWLFSKPLVYQTLSRLEGFKLLSSALGQVDLQWLKRWSDARLTELNYNSQRFGFTSEGKFLVSLYGQSSINTPTFAATHKLSEFSMFAGLNTFAKRGYLVYESRMNLDWSEGFRLPDLWVYAGFRTSGTLQIEQGLRVIASYRTAGRIILSTGEQLIAGVRMGGSFQVDQGLVFAGGSRAGGRVAIAASDGLVAGLRAGVRLTLDDGFTFRGGVRAGVRTAVEDGSQPAIVGLRAGGSYRVDSGEVLHGGLRMGGRFPIDDGLVVRAGLKVGGSVSLK